MTTALQSYVSSSVPIGGQLSFPRSAASVVSFRGGIFLRSGSVIASSGTGLAGTAMEHPIGSLTLNNGGSMGGSGYAVANRVANNGTLYVYPWSTSSSSGTQQLSHSSAGGAWNVLTHTQTGFYTDVILFASLFIWVGKDTFNNFAVINTTAATLAGLSNPTNRYTNGTAGTAMTSVAANAAGTVAVAVGSSGILLSSTNGTTWTPRTNPLGTSQNMTVVRWCPTAGVFLAGDASGRTISSPDGITWTQRTTLNPSPVIDFVEIGSTIFAICASTYTIFTATANSTPTFAAQSVSWPGTGAAPNNVPGGGSPLNYTYVTGVGAFLSGLAGTLTFTADFQSFKTFSFATMPINTVMVRTASSLQALTTNTNSAGSSLPYLNAEAYVGLPAQNTDPPGSALATASITYLRIT